MLLYIVFEITDDTLNFTNIYCVSCHNAVHVANEI